MSSSAKTGILVLILVIIAAGAYWYYMNSSSSPQAITQSGQGSTSQQVTSPKDTSDAALVKDTTNIDTHMGSLDSDSANIDQGLNDQPVSQTQ